VNGVPDGEIPVAAACDHRVNTKGAVIDKDAHERGRIAL
jgi:hypothetical protein